MKMEGSVNEIRELRADGFAGIVPQPKAAVNAPQSRRSAINEAPIMRAAFGLRWLQHRFGVSEFLVPQSNGLA